VKNNPFPEKWILVHHPRPVERWIPAFAGKAPEASHFVADGATVEPASAIVRIRPRRCKNLKDWHRIFTENVPHRPLASKLVREYLVGGWLGKIRPEGRPPIMPKHAKPLTAAKVRTAAAGSYTDGLGLMLLVQKSGSAQWQLRFRFGEKRRDMGLGPARGLDAVPLAEARQRAAEARALVRAGVDPVQTRRAARAGQKEGHQAAEVITFSRAAAVYLETHEAGWKNAKHRAQWRMTLSEYAGPILGDCSAAEITTADVLAVLQPLWTKVPETATRLRARIEAVLDLARVKGWRAAENPARWRGHLDKLLVARSKIRPVKHHAALPWGELPQFLAELGQREGTAARALEFAILTAARSGEVLGVRWSEIDLDASVWTVPAGRMKARREHRVPLANNAVAVLRTMLPFSDGSSGLVFPGQGERRPLSIMALGMILRRMGRGDLTVHGFRSTFRDWAGETTAHPREVVEQALAHRTGDRVEQAYARGDLFTKRRRLMADWATYCGKAQSRLVRLTPGGLTRAFAAVAD
jgi:integrase